MSGYQLDIRGRVALHEYGWDFDHATGHGIGYFLNVEEGLYLLRIVKLCNGNDRVDSHRGAVLFASGFTKTLNETFETRANVSRPAYRIEVPSLAFIEWI